MQYVQPIKLDVANRNLYKCIYAKQGDAKSRYIKATILANGEQVTISSGMTAKFRAEKPDGKAILNPAVVNDDGTVTFELTKQTLAAGGVVDADIVISSASGEEISTVPFKIEVEKAPHGSLTDSKNEMLVLQKLIDDSEAALKKLGNVKDGKDGVSPTVSIAATSGGTKVTITDAKGSHEFVVKDGAKGNHGTAGQDGHSPVVTATKSGKKTTIRVDGADIATVEDGADGKPGAAGAAGKDGAGMDITGATVGQIAKITAVDASGAPTAWSPADMPSGGSPDAVLYTAQTLAGAQKKQARENIDAASSDFVVTATLDDDNNCTVNKTFAQIQEAVQAGKKPVVRLDQGGTTVTMPLVASGGYFGFAGSILINPPMSAQFVVSIQDNNEVVFDMSYGLGLGHDNALPQVRMSKDPREAMEIATKQYVDDALDGKAGTAAATKSAAGLMSAADKAKLDGIERGANKTTVPTALKNPNALTIKIGGTTVTYDGSAAKTVTIADGSEVAY